MAKPPSTPSRSRKDRPANVVPMSRARKEDAAPPGAPRGDGAAIAARVAATVVDRERLIAERAYFLAERRGFAPGGELEDWLAAEREIDRAQPRS